MTTIRRFIIICDNTPLAHRDNEPYWLQFARDADVYTTRQEALRNLRKQLRRYDIVAKKENGIYAGVVGKWKQTIKIIPIRLRIDAEGRLR